MKIYFAGSISGGRDDKELYFKIIQLLKDYGEVLTEHIGNQALSQIGEDGANEYIYKRDIKWLKESDLVVAEVTTPSLGVGFEVSKAVEWKKNILCIYRKIEGKRLSAMIAGCPKIKVFEYKTISNLKTIFDLDLKL